MTRQPHNSGLLVGSLVLLLLSLLQAPAVWLAFHTPFSLIDDYGDWRCITIFSNLGNGLLWLEGAFLNHDVVRSIPMFELYTGLTWTLFQTNSFLHHLTRLAIKVVIVVFGVLTIRLFRAQGLHKDAIPFSTSSMLFISLFSFWPNTPEARLGPQELLTVLFLSIHLFYLCKLFAFGKRFAAATTGEGVILLLTLLGLSWSKELNIVFVFVSCIVISSSIRNAKQLLSTVPYLIVFTLALTKAVAFTNHSFYGPPPPLDLDRVLQSTLFYFNNGFLWASMKLFPVAALFGVGSYILLLDRYRQKCRKQTFVQFFLGQNQQSSAFRGSALVLAMFFSYLCLVPLIWVEALRYFYPLVYLLAILVSLSYGQLEYLLFRGPLLCRGRKYHCQRYHKAFRILTVIFCAYFILGNYYNFLMQYASQYYTRTAEHRLIKQVTNLLDKGATVCVAPKDEFLDHLVDYFNRYSPRFHGTDTRISVRSDSGGTQGCTYEVIHTLGEPPQLTPEQQIVSKISSEEDTFGILRYAWTVSTIIQGGTPYTKFDAGAQRCDSPLNKTTNCHSDWYLIFRKPIAE